MIRISVDFKDSKKFSNLIRYIKNNVIYGEAQERIRILGHHTADNMHKEINDNRKRPSKVTHKLENSILAETLNTVGGIDVGIGRISKMNQEAPYWEMLNDGATYKTKTYHVVPFEDGEFRTFPVGSSHVIEGIDFVGKAIRKLDDELKETMKQLGASFIEGAGKASK